MKHDFSEIKTERLLLRPLSITDQKEIFELRTHEEVGRFIQRKRPAGMEAAQEFIQMVHEGMAKGECVMWGIAPKAGGAIMGTICLWNFDRQDHSVEIGYEMLPEYQGQGFMQEAAEAVLEYGWDRLELEMIKGYVHFQNASSIRLLERNQFHLCGCAPDHEDMLLYAKNRK